MGRKKSKSQKNRNLIAFLAYPSSDKIQADVLERAAGVINGNKRSGVQIRSWKHVSKDSSRIIMNILGAIDRCDYVIADVSGLNSNVLFEVGYALAKRKRLVLMSQGNSDSERERDLEDCHLLSGLEVVPVRNTNDAVEAIRSRIPPQASPKPDLDAFVLVNVPNHDGIFLRGSVAAEPALVAARTFHQIFPNCLEDDWAEDSAQPLHWYLSVINGAQAVAAVLVQESWNDSRKINSRYSLLCGIAVGLGKRVCMMGLQGYQPAFDYKDWFVRAGTATQAQKAIQSFFWGLRATGSEGLRAQVAAGRGVSVAQPMVEPEDKEILILSIAIEGLMQNIAEHEQTELDDYFVRTARFMEALSGKQQVFIGSKGSGKTANFYQLKRELLRDPHNVVCDIKPSDYDMGRFLEALSRVRQIYGAQQHVCETAWKLIVYCELIEALCNEIESRPAYLPVLPDERLLIDFYTEHVELITSGFEKRLDRIAEWLMEERYNEENFSKRCHDRFLTPAAHLLERVFDKLEGRVVVLLDNLDKAWDKTQDLSLQAIAIHGLLSSCPEIENDLHRKANVDLIVFLRRNIFEFVVETGREPDKLMEQAAELVWDRDTLLQVVDERVRRGFPKMDPWKELFPKTVQGEDTRRWIYARIMHRPRDLIRFVRRAMQAAGDHRHQVVTEEDLLDALKDYSEWAKTQTVAEYKTENPWLESAIASLMGTTEVQDLRDLEMHLEQALGDAESPILPRVAVQKLVQAGIVGIGIGQEVRFAETIQDSLILRRKVETHPPKRPLTMYIHPALHPHLGIVRGSRKPRSWFRQWVEKMVDAFE